mmetsp:Transcript_121521/g.294875  ORF Transcript_121521/g.294875 Transcript_121521/m.294875 type:complete len:204 (+) Transcript_121521:219-830(+)
MDPPISRSSSSPWSSTTVPSARIFIFVSSFSFSFSILSLVASFSATTFALAGRTLLRCSSPICSSVASESFSSPLSSIENTLSGGSSSFSAGVIFGRFSTRSRAGGRAGSGTKDSLAYAVAAAAEASAARIAAAASATSLDRCAFWASAAMFSRSSSSSFAACAIWDSKSSRSSSTAAGTSAIRETAFETLSFVSEEISSKTR